MNACMLQNLSTAPIRPPTCSLYLLIYSPFSLRFHAETFSYPYDEVVDFTSTMCFDRSASIIYLTNRQGITELRLDERREQSYRFHHKKLLGSDRAHITCVVNDDLLPGNSGANRLFVGSRNGQIHHVDLRSQPTNTIFSLQQKQMRYSIHKISTLPQISPFSIVASDICNEIALFDIRSVNKPYMVIQKGLENGSIQKPGYWLSGDNKVILTQFTDQSKGNKGAIKLAYYSTSNAYARIGDPVPFAVDDVGLFGSIIFANNVSTYDGSSPYEYKETIYRGEEVGDKILEGSERYVYTEEAWGMYTAASSCQLQNSGVRIFTVGDISSRYNAGTALEECDA
jgi:hypothetical protein